jgi:hypothetical protein
MTANRNLNINMSLKGTEKVQTDLNGANRAFEGLKQTGTGAMTDLSKMMLRFVSIGAVIGIVKNWTSAWLDQEEAIRKLTTALGRNSQTLIAHANRMQNITGVSNDAIITAQSLIAAFIKEEKQIKRVTEAALDFARAKGIDVNTAADLLTKTIASSTNALGRYGIEVKGSGWKQRET